MYVVFSIFFALGAAGALLSYWLGGLSLAINAFGIMTLILASLLVWAVWRDNSKPEPKSA